MKGNKNDANDAEAICEAVGRPSMRFVPMKSTEQQDIQMLHRVRSGLVKERTAQANRLRGLLGEYGIVIGAGLTQVRNRLPEILEDGENGLSGLAREILADCHRQVLELDKQVSAYAEKIHSAGAIFVEVVYRLFTIPLLLGMISIVVRGQSAREKVF